MGRIPKLTVVFAIFVLTGCGQPAVVQFGASWREFLELDGSPATSARRVGGHRRAQPLVADVAATVEQIRQIYVDADSYLQGFPGLESRYRSMVEGYRQQIEKDRNDKNITDPEILRRRMEQVAGQVRGIYERIHRNAASVQDSYKDRLEVLMDHAGELEKSCNELQRTTQPPADQIQACSRFQDAFTMLKTKSGLVAGSFTRMEDVYSESRKAIDQIAAEAVAAPGKATPALPAKTTKSR